MKLTDLTHPQYCLLVELSDRPQRVATYFSPAKKLVSLALAEWKAGKTSEALVITEAGRALLKAEGEK